MRQITYMQAINEAIAEEMERDDRVILMGEDVGVMGGVFGVTAGLFDRFGPERVLDTPISEMFIVGGAVGAALTGMRPIAELQFADFIWNAADETYAKMSKWRYMHGGQVTVPMVLRLPSGSTGGQRCGALGVPRGVDAAAPGGAHRRTVHPRRRQGPVEGGHSQ